MLLSSLDTINMYINPDRYQSIHSFSKPPKMQLTSEQRIFVVTHYLKTTRFKEVQQHFELRFGSEFRKLKLLFAKML